MPTHNHSRTHLASDRSRSSSATRRFIVVVELEYDGRLTLTCPSLPDVGTYGRTEQQARERLREAILLQLDSLRALGPRLPDGDDAVAGAPAVEVPR